MKTNNNGIEMPEDFNCEKYDEIHINVHSLINPKEPLPEVWIEFSSGWNAISYRYKAMGYHDEMFRNSLGDRGHEGRYIQERELFNFFVNSLSALETFFYSIYFIGKYIDPVIFKEDSWNVTPKITYKRYLKKYPHSSITKFLEALLDDRTFEEIKEVRNILAHRNSPGRKMFMTVGKKVNPPDKWNLKDLIVDETLTSDRRKWLSQNISNVFDVTLAFLKNDI